MKYSYKLKRAIIKLSRWLFNVYFYLVFQDTAVVRDSMVSKYNLTSCKRTFKNYRFYCKRNDFIILNMLYNCCYYCMFALKKCLIINQHSFCFDVFLSNITVKVNNCKDEHLLANNYKLKHLHIVDSKIVPAGFCFNDIMLEKVIIGKDTKVIQHHAFENCLSLKTIYIPHTIEQIESYAFLNCASLSNVFFY